MTHDPAALYTAYAARDPRFDGVFYVGVTSTGIYCRPVCPARTPRAANCRFFDSAEAAEQARFRPCLRCRPELAPGNAPVDDGQRIAALVVERMNEGQLTGGGLEEVAARLGWSSRQIRRIVHRELGVSPMQLLLTRRLLLAKQLLTETALPVTEVAYASGFASLRRFNDAFRRRYDMPPTLGEHRGWVRVRNAPAGSALLVELPHALTPVLPGLLGRLRHLFDLSARPDVVNAHLRQDPALAAAVARNPGLRVPGAFDGFELAVRAVLGQQVSVKAATTLGGRLAAAFGDPVITPHAPLVRLCPSPARIASAGAAGVAAVGIMPARARTIVALAREVAGGQLVLEPGANPTRTIAALVALPGIGPWTAHYIAMRALRWPDAFPKEDMVLRQRLGGVTAAGAEVRSQAWSPWRSYATLHLWQGGIAEPA